MTKTPPNACDCHIHVFNQRFPAVEKGASVRTGADVEDYLEVQKQMGTNRTVIVHARVFVTDNDATLDAIERLGRKNTRGIGVLNPDVSNMTLQKMDNGGIRGVRFTLFKPENAPTRFDMVEPLARRIEEYGWHVQLHWTADQIVEHEAMLRRLPCAIVFDHFARITSPDHPAFKIVCDLIDQGRTWVKLAAPYLNSKRGLAHHYDDCKKMAHEFIKKAPERLVWGSDWPHVTETNIPDDRLLLAILDQWVDTPQTRERILVQNPAQLYQFDD